MKQKSKSFSLASFFTQPHRNRSQPTDIHSDQRNPNNFIHFPFSNQKEPAAKYLLSSGRKPTFASVHKHPLFASLGAIRKKTSKFHPIIGSVDSIGRVCHCHTNTTVQVRAPHLCMFDVPIVLSFSLSCAPFKALIHFVLMATSCSSLRLVKRGRGCRVFCRSNS